jgi:hypothetical protein
MPKRPNATRRWATAATWPLGIVLTSWDYMWRSTPLHRREHDEADLEAHLPPPFPPHVDADEVIAPADGRGPLFHRRYATLIRDTSMTPEELLGTVAEDINRAAPTTFARFQKVSGDPGPLIVGDEYVVRMPGPWDGPVRVIDRSARSFRLATLKGHLEAGQIEFRAVGDAAEGRVRFEIESWARSAGRVSNLLYHRLHMAKEVQLHMWISFLERVTKLAGGRMTGGIEVVTHRLTEAGR